MAPTLCRINCDRTLCYANNVFSKTQFPEHLASRLSLVFQHRDQVRMARVLYIPRNDGADCEPANCFDWLYEYSIHAFIKGLGIQWLQIEPLGLNNTSKSVSYLWRFPNPEGHVCWIKTRVQQHDALEEHSLQFRVSSANRRSYPSIAASHCLSLFVCSNRRWLPLLLHNSPSGHTWKVLTFSHRESLQLSWPCGSSIGEPVPSELGGCFPQSSDLVSTRTE